MAEARRKRLNNRYYPLEMPLSFTALRRGHVIQRGRGETVEMSSTGLKVKLLDNLDAKTTDIVIAIAWPAKLADGASLQLVVQTKPDWSSSPIAEFEILKHEFRIAAKAAVSIAAPAGFALAGVRTERMLPPRLVPHVQLPLENYARPQQRLSQQFH